MFSSLSVVNGLDRNQVSENLDLTGENCVVSMDDAVADLAQTQGLSRSLLVGLCGDQTLFKCYLFQIRRLLKP